MNNLSLYCGLVDARISASDKDLPVSSTENLAKTKVMMKYLNSRFFCTTKDQRFKVSLS